MKIATSVWAGLLIGNNRSIDCIKLAPSSKDKVFS